ncbi:MarR family winged helix-turn-helix transcriptional regulator [Pseudonocardia oroxyli]|jgi:DNA-binding MarR family transcriptional regulator|uniref:DNA-binding transcriptional regulator, MarR family n=1 Tax=Pseudonocardia oroxyli TaxID=366584 RepID=A0A1G7VLH5_PSEOR|nr:MarR family transcriptional regulator [Pseudonocardia oroxyli]SDG60547.1 DNA-binding transcriptional regulator, MarR family [Pseudonocardia oroxyli]
MSTRDGLVDQVLRAVAAWQIPVIQLNGLIAERLGMTWTDLQALYVLANHGPTTPGELAKRVALTSGSGSRMIDRLVAAGFVRRVPDGRDRRRVLVEPVPEAVARVGGLYDRLNDRHRADLAALSASELTALLGFLRRASDSTEEEIRDF